MIQEFNHSVNREELELKSSINYRGKILTLTRSYESLQVLEDSLKVDREKSEESLTTLVMARDQEEDEGIIADGATTVVKKHKLPFGLKLLVGSMTEVAYDEAALTLGPLEFVAPISPTGKVQLLKLRMEHERGNRIFGYGGATGARFFKLVKATKPA